MSEHINDPFCTCEACNEAFEQQWQNSPAAQRMERQFDAIVQAAGIMVGAVIRRNVQAPILIPMEDELIHTDEHPFCDDPSCGCHDDVELIMEHLERPFDAGLLTSPEYFRIKEGKQL